MKTNLALDPEKWIKEVLDVMVDFSQNRDDHGVRLPMRWSFAHKLPIEWCLWRMVKLLKSVRQSKYGFTLQWSETKNFLQNTMPLS